MQVEHFHITVVRQNAHWEYCRIREYGQGSVGRRPLLNTDIWYYAFYPDGSMLEVAFIGIVGSIW